MAYLICSYKSQILELTVKEEGNDFIVTGEDLKKLNFGINNKAIIMTGYGSIIVIEKIGDAYKVVENESTYNFLDLKDNEEIKLKIYQPTQNL